MESFTQIGLIPDEREEPYFAGDVIAGKYRLLRRLDSGGMGVVWVAHNIALDADVAMKFVRAGDGAGPASARLLREAQAAARLDHPAIVRVFDLDQTASGDPFIVMELLLGESLAARLLRERRIDATSAVSVLLPIAEALSALHERRIVHRDLKPGNIFLARRSDGRVQPKLLDFGIVRLDEGRFTMRGAVLGSPGYLSPEQARGLDADQRSDVWGFCVVLYEMVAGRRPFSGSNGWSLFRDIMEGDPEPISNHGVSDPDLSAIVSRGLSKSPEDRWPSMRELGEALASWLAARGVRDDVCGVSLASTWSPKPSAPPGAPRAEGPSEEPHPPSFSTVTPIEPGASSPEGHESGSPSTKIWFATAIGAVAALLLAGAAIWGLARPPSRPAAAASQRSPDPPSMESAAAPAATPTQTAGSPSVDADSRGAIDAATTAPRPAAPAAVKVKRSPARARGGELKDPYREERR